MAQFVAHTGDVYLNGKSMYEVTNLQGDTDPVCSDASWNPDFSVYTWYAMQDEKTDETVLTANFHGLDPNEEEVETSVRKAAFFHCAKESTISPCLALP